MEAYMNWKKLAVTALVCMSVSAPVWAAGDPSDEVTPNDWSYKALMTLEKHGAITDMRGIHLGTQNYTRSQLTPLIAYVVNKRESMNESDRMLAIRLYSEYRDDLMAYERDQEIAAGKAQGKTTGLTAKDIQLRMQEFHIDRSAVNVNGDVRVRFQDGAGKSGRSDYRTRVEMVFGGNGANGTTSAANAPAELVDEQGKAQLAQADAELEKARKESIQRQAAEQVAALKAQEQAKKDKAQNQKQLDKEAAQLQKADAKAAKQQAEAEAKAAKAQAAAEAKAAKQQAEADAKAAKAKKEADAKDAKDAAKHDEKVAKQVTTTTNEVTK
jgi:chemotaxis protein histidine kinase CheA